MKWTACNISFWGTVVFTSWILLLSSYSACAAENVTSLEECVNIENDAKRLQCFDTFMGRKNPEKETVMEAVVASPPSPDVSSEPTTLSVRFAKAQKIDTGDDKGMP